MLFRNVVLLPAAALAADMQVTKGLDYVGDGDNHHKMDLYMPSSSSENTPVVVWIAGTAFAGLGYDRIGMAEKYPCPQLTEKGIGCAAIAYSSSPWPAQHEDTRAAVRFLRANGKQGKYGLGGGKIGVHGASSGGNQAGHIWSSGHLEDEAFGSEFKRIGQYPQESAAVSAAAIYWPEYHLDPDDEPKCEFSDARKNPHGPQSEANYASNVDNVKKMSAETYLDSSTPPAYMVHGTSDQQVSPCNTVEAYELAKSKGIDVDVTYVQGGDHGCAQFGPVWSNGCTNCHGVDPDVLAKMLAFFEKNLKGEDPPSPPTPPAPPSPPAPSPRPTPPAPTPTPGPSPVPAACEQCLGQACPQLKDTGAAECYSCLETNKRSCAASCHSASYTFDQLKSMYCDAKEVQV